MQRKLFSQKLNNAPTGTGQLHQYLSVATKAQVEKMAQYSTDFFEAEVQGIEGDNPEEYNWYKIRASSQFSSFNTMQTSLGDDWRVVYFQRTDIDYIKPGTKFKFWNNVWIADNPSNIASLTGNALVKRCNAVWNSLDFYGNIVSEPMVIMQPATKANANTDTETMQLTDSYADCIMQANEWTLANLRNNTRMILGSSGFAVRGLSDYIREFTEQSGSVRILRFSIYYQEPTERDDMVEQIADGLSFSWDIVVSGNKSASIGNTSQLNATSVRNGELIGTDVEVSYEWSSSDETVATVDENGLVTAVSDGSTSIRCTLSQNTDIYTEIKFLVQPETIGMSWATERLPDSIVVYQESTLSVSNPESDVNWEFSGPERSCYGVSTDGNSATITCYSPSTTPLIVSVSDGTTTLTTNIQLIVR